MMEDKTAKARWSSMPWEALSVCVDVITIGAVKHCEEIGEYPLAVSEQTIPQHLDACFRHLVAHRTGTPIDPETNRPHLAHASIRCLFALTRYLRGLP